MWFPGLSAAPDASLSCPPLSSKTALFHHRAWLWVYAVGWSNIRRSRCCRGGYWFVHRVVTSVSKLVAFLNNVDQRSTLMWIVILGFIMMANSLRRTHRAKENIKLWQHGRGTRCRSECWRSIVLWRSINNGESVLRTLGLPACPAVTSG
jgi:hypothetical protein